MVNPSGTGDAIVDFVESGPWLVVAYGDGIVVPRELRDPLLSGNLEMAKPILTVV